MREIVRSESEFKKGGRENENEDEKISIEMIKQNAENTISSALVYDPDWTGSALHYCIIILYILYKMEKNN